MANLSQILYAMGDHRQAIKWGEEACDVLERMGSPQAHRIRAQMAAWKRARKR